MLIQLIFHNTVDTIQTMKNVFDVEVGVLTIFKEFVKMQTWHFYLLSLIEICLIKYWLKYLRKRLVSMDETFIVWSLNLINIMISISLSSAKIMLDEEFQGSELNHKHYKYNSW